MTKVVKAQVPLAGTVRALKDVPDRVFAQEMMGQGLAIDPLVERETFSVYAPASGSLDKLLPHAFVIAVGEQLNLLVHLGIDTVQCPSQAFRHYVRQGQHVESGQLMVDVDVSKLEQASSLICPVVVFAPATARTLLPAGQQCQPGQDLLELYP